MVPAQPPLPTASNLPFQFSDGSQASISISESEDGFSTAATRHRAGRLSGGGAGAGPRPPAAAAGGPPAGVGIVSGPAGTSSAAVMMVPGSASDFRLSHGAAANTLPAITKAMLIMVSYRYGL